MYQCNLRPRINYTYEPNAHYAIMMIGMPAPLITRFDITLLGAHLNEFFLQVSPNGTNRVT